MAGAEDLPFALLATGFRLLRDIPSEISGFFYFSGAVPRDIVARKTFTWSLFKGECCQVVLRGSEAQVESLLRVAAVTSGWSSDNALGIDGCISAAREMNLPFCFDNLEEPSGRGLPIEGGFWLEESELEIAERLKFLRDELELTLASGWVPHATWL